MVPEARLCASYERNSCLRARSHAAMPSPMARLAAIKRASVLATAIAGLLAGCTGSGSRAARPPGNDLLSAKTINLQNGASPSFLAVGPHDTLWFTENGGNDIARADAAGAVKRIFRNRG